MLLKDNSDSLNDSQNDIETNSGKKDSASGSTYSFFLTRNPADPNKNDKSRQCGILGQF